MTKKKLPPPGRHRVEAWIYGVINPLAEALEREHMLCLGHVPTYRWRTLNLERILPFRGYLSRGAILILEDLASHDRGFVKLEKRHDALVELVRSSAQRVFGAAVNDPEFRSVVEKHFAKIFDGSDSMYSDVAEDLVNDNSERINARAGTYEDIWNQRLPDLKKLRQRFHYSDLNAALQKLRVDSERMLRELVELRTSLVQEFDVPPAPLGV